MVHAMRSLATVGLAVLLCSMETRNSHSAVLVEPDGPEFIVNDLQFKSQISPDVATVAPHEALVVWMGPSAEGLSVGGIWARYVDDTGPLGDDLLLDPDHTRAPTFYPKVAVAPDGSSAVIFQSETGNRGSKGGIYLRTLNPDGTGTGDAERQVHTDLSGFQMVGDVAAGDDGTYLVAWYDQTSLLANVTLLLRRFDRNGDPLSEELPVAEGALFPLQQTLPIAALPGGRFVTAWATLGEVQTSLIGSDDSISGPRTLTSGRPAAQPSVLACDDGRHLVVWSSPVVETLGTELLGQWLDQNGDDIGTVEVLARSFRQWGTYDTPSATMMPGCTALLHFHYQLVLATPTSVTRGEFYRDEFAAIAASSNRRFVRVAPTPEWPGSDVYAQWLCILHDENSCGDATCIGDADADGRERINLRDTLRTLRSAIGLDRCNLCRCDANGSGDTTVADAAQILRFAMGHDVELACEACEETAP
jgi:hypothetical protein